MNSKRVGDDSILLLRPSKQPRMALKQYDGSNASPSEGAGLLSKWSALGVMVWELGKETMSHVINKRPPSSGRLPKTTTRHTQRSSPYPVSQALRPRRTSSQTSSSVSGQAPALPSIQINFTPRPTATYDSPVVFQSPRLGSLPPPPRSRSRRPAQNGAMGPPQDRKTMPPPPPKSTEPFPQLPGTPIRDRGGSLAPSEFSIGSSSTNAPNRRTRKHILAERHEKTVKEELLKDKAEMTRYLYERSRQTGYASDYKTFEDFLNYKATLEQAEKLKASGLYTSERVRISGAQYERARRHSLAGADATPQVSTAYLESLLRKSIQTLQQPGPARPFSPSLDQLQLRQRHKDSLIENRMRPKRVPLPSSLPPEEEAAVSALLRKRGVISKCASEQVSHTDLSRLQPGQWLNDEIINFYGALLLGRSEASKENVSNSTTGVNGAVKANGIGPSKKSLNVHYFSTFFWQKLEQDGYERGRLAKWTKKFDLFAKDVALIPVNHNNVHWTAAAINFRRKRIEAYDSMSTYSSKVYTMLRKYIEAEHMNKKKAPFDWTGWEDHHLEDTPQQENGYDCGVFTCQFLESISRGEEHFNFTQKDVPYLRRKMIWEIGNATLWTPKP